MDAQLAAFIKRVAGLKPGLYIIVLTVMEDGAFEWAISERMKVERCPTK